MTPRAPRTRFVKDCHGLARLARSCAAHSLRTSGARGDVAPRRSAYAGRATVPHSMRTGSGRSTRCATRRGVRVIRGRRLLPSSIPKTHSSAWGGRRSAYLRSPTGCRHLRLADIRGPRPGRRIRHRPRPVGSVVCRRCVTCIANRRQFLPALQQFVRVQTLRRLTDTRPPPRTVIGISLWHRDCCLRPPLQPSSRCLPTRRPSP